MTDLGGTSLGCMGVSLKSGDPNLGAPGLSIWNIANFRKGRERESGKGTSHIVNVFARFPLNNFCSLGLVKYKGILV